MRKWQISASYQLSVGDIVVIHEDETMPGKWPLARMIQTHPGKDGIILAITLRTAGGNVYTRPVTKVTHILS